MFLRPFLIACSVLFVSGAASSAEEPKSEVAAKPIPKISRTPLVLRQGGTPDKPAVFDGQGMVIDLGIDVTGEEWTKNGDLWTSQGPIQKRPPQEAGNFPGLFVDELPIVIPRDREAEKLHPDRRGKCYLAPEKLAPGQMGYAADGSFYFRWPQGKTPGTDRVILPPTGLTSCVTVACSHIIVRNVTVKHASNDGVNIHGKWIGIRLENVKAFSNCDEGISAHDDVQMDVADSEIAFNGSQAGGVADVNRCTTTYKNCTLHDNVGAAFHFTGKSHRVSDIRIYNQSRDFSIGPMTEVIRERVDWRK